MRRLFAFAVVLAWATQAAATTCDRCGDYSEVVQCEAPAHWYHLDEPSGTTAADSGSLSIAGTYVGGFTLGVTGIVGNAPDTATEFDGVNGRVELNNPPGDQTYGPPVGTGQGFTVEAWVKPQSVANQALIGKYEAAHEVWQFGLRSTPNFQFKFYQDTAGSCVGGTYGELLAGTYTTGQWYYVVGTTTGNAGSGLGQMNLYVNGNLIASTSSFTGTLCTDNALATLADLNDNIFFLDGVLDEPAIYYDNNPGPPHNGILTPYFIALHYTAGLSTANGTCDWPYNVKAPQLPKFRDDGYLARFVSQGFNTGLFSIKALIPQYLNPGFMPFSTTPKGNFR